MLFGKKTILEPISKIPQPMINKIVEESKYENTIEILTKKTKRLNQYFHICLSRQFKILAVITQARAYKDTRKKIEDSNQIDITKTSLKDYHQIRMAKRRYELGLILLLVQIINLGADAIPPVTLSLVFLQAVLYMNIIRKPWTTLGMYKSILRKPTLRDFEPKKIGQKAIYSKFM